MREVFSATKRTGIDHTQRKPRRLVSVCSSCPSMSCFFPNYVIFLSGNGLILQQSRHSYIILFWGKMGKRINLSLTILMRYSHACPNKYVFHVSWVCCVFIKANIHTVMSCGLYRWFCVLARTLSLGDWIWFRKRCDD